MELPVRLTTIERVLALALLAPVLWTARLEGRSPVAAAARRGTPWACWLALKAPSNALPQIFLAYYRPQARTLDLVYVAENLRLLDNKTLPQLAAAARKAGASTDGALAAALAQDAAQALTPDAPEDLRDALAPQRVYFDAFDPDDEEPPVAAKDWLRSRLRGRAVLRRLFSKRAPRQPLAGFELARLALELRPLSDDQLRAVWLPEDEADRAAYFQRLEPGAVEAPRPADHPVTVEVLNATPKPGIANAAKKILRFNGADVMSTGNAPARSRTLVVDRVGKPEQASAVRRMLGCPTAQAVTQVDAKRLVDVSVIIADDCALRE